MEADPTQDVLGPKKRNYQFLQLVRDKNYPDALLLGKLILKDQPNNPSVRKFVQFIQKNAKKLDDMVKQEQQYESVHSDDSSQEQQVQGQAQKNGDTKSSSESSDKQQEEEQEEEQEQKPQKKVELTTCTLNQIPHVCPRHHKLIIEATSNGKM